MNQPSQALDQSDFGSQLLRELSFDEVVIVGGGQGETVASW
jgi:hypothetical protein